MRRYVVSIAVFASLMLSAPGAAWGIYGGEDANISEFPWIVGIQKGGSDWCTGTLVAPSWVLTAAHCVTSPSTGATYDPGDFQAFVGVNKMDGAWPTGEARGVAEVIPYPGSDGKPLVWQEPIWRGDIALMKLTAPVFNVPSVQLSYGEMPLGTALTAAGFGSTKDDFFTTEVSPRLQKIDHIRVKSDGDCFDDAEVAAIAICTKADASYIVLRGGPRKGDSGGPVLLRLGDRWIQLGVMSHAPRACIRATRTNCSLIDLALAKDGDPNFSGWASMKRYRSWVTSKIQQATAAAAVSTALVIDSSGSMTSNDPGNRRLSAASSYLTASLPGDEVGIVDFDDSASIVSEAIPVDLNRTQLESAIQSIDSSGGTALGAGLNAGCQVLTRASGTRRAAIFLTDGQGSYSNESTCFAQNGWPVFTIGLGSGVDSTLLERIASETGGSYLQLASSLNLVCEFQQIRSQVAGLGRSSCTPTGTIQPNQTISFASKVLSLLKQVTFTNTWPGSDIKMTVTSPSGQAYDRSSVAAGVAVSVGGTYESITVTDPEPGDWTVELYGADVSQNGEPYTFSTVALPKEGDQLDSDNDGVADPQDNCAYVQNPGQDDADADGDGDLCDPDPGLIRDHDDDGVEDQLDNCPTVANPGQGDVDADGFGDPCDPDDDNDAVNDEADRCASTVLPEPAPVRWSRNRFVADAEGQFVDLLGRRARITVTDTMGCSGRQIVEAMKLGSPHIRHGITKGALKCWVAIQRGDKTNGACRGCTHPRGSAGLTCCRRSPCCGSARQQGAHCHHRGRVAKKRPRGHSGSR